MTYDTVIVGGGPAGLSAALGAKRKGAKNILILERSEKLGGIMNQCIHNGFGVHTFKTELTGPEYAYRYIDMVEKENIPYILGATVLSIAPHSVTYISEEGLRTVSTLSIVLAMGCRERPRGALNIPGTRPSGVFSAGTAQNLVNLKGRKLGKRVVILGSGDIGLIMARRMTLEGAKVLAVVELMPYSSGLKRNIVQCLDDFFGDQNGICILFTCMYDSVSYCTDFIHGSNHAVFLVLNCHQNLCNGILMVFHRSHQLVLVHADLFMSDNRAFHADSFHKALCQ